MSNITIDINYFEHLLNCLANQKFIHEYNEAPTRSEHQAAIDKAWNEGMSMLSNYRKETKKIEKKEKYCRTKMDKYKTRYFNAITGLEV